MEFMHIDELEKRMTPEQKKKAKEMYDKYYGIPFGHLEPVYPAIESTEEYKRTNGEEYLKKVNMEDWD